MHPVEFPEMNTKLVAPGCGDLPVAHCGTHIVSCWDLTDEDRKRIADGGKIWFTIHAPFHPPILLTTDCPIVDQNEWPEDVESKSAVSIGIPSSGNPEKDQKALERFARNDELIKNGKCPNGCGNLIADRSNCSRCPRCGFSHSYVRPL